ncbi:hypothetical protein SAMN04487935_3501 [Flavobacterium noncentrifugens]|uniref:Uncharacterized protein n=1 Tax=Flavobacterium noncentrifugens TaxID=1128970 RepID=A0A1G9CEX6_9FLAO|nr:hypothetical protein SAMN04487935_3501 [Flavobacterium noncentrifugens]
MPLQAVSTIVLFFLDHIFKLSSKNKTTHKLFSSFKFDLLSEVFKFLVLFN